MVIIIIRVIDLSPMPRYCFISSSTKKWLLLIISLWDITLSFDHCIMPRALLIIHCTYSDFPPPHTMALSCNHHHYHSERTLTTHGPWISWWNHMIKSILVWVIIIIIITPPPQSSPPSSFSSSSRVIIIILIMDSPRGHGMPLSLVPGSQ